jgi:hypothetical protein
MEKSTGSISGKDSGSGKGSERHPYPYVFVNTLPNFEGGKAMKLDWKPNWRAHVMATCVLALAVLFVSNAVRGCGGVQAGIDGVDNVRIEKVAGEKSWTLVFEMKDGSERAISTVQAMVVAAEIR